MKEIRRSRAQPSGDPAAAAGDRFGELTTGLLALPPTTRSTCRLEGWDPRSGEQGCRSLARAYWAARRMALGYPTVGHMLTLAGATGVGKTRLALAIAWEWVERFEKEPWSLLSDKEMVELLKVVPRPERWTTHDQERFRRPVWPRDHGVRFARVGDLLDLLQKGYEDGSYYSLLDECYTCRLLVLDDLGHQRETAWRAEMMDRIIDARYMRRLFTVVTTNLSGEQLPPRIASRLRDRSTGFVAAIEVDDYRPMRTRKVRFGNV